MGRYVSVIGAVVVSTVVLAACSTGSTGGDSSPSPTPSPSSSDTGLPPTFETAAVTPGVTFTTQIPEGFQLIAPSEGVQLPPSGISDGTWSWPASEIAFTSGPGAALFQIADIQGTVREVLLADDTAYLNENGTGWTLSQDENSLVPFIASASFTFVSPSAETVNGSLVSSAMIPFTLAEVQYPLFTVRLDSGLVLEDVRVVNTCTETVVVDSTEPLCVTTAGDVTLATTYSKTATVNPGELYGEIPAGTR